MLNVNFTGTFVLTQEVVRSIKRRENSDGGIIVFTSSQGGLLGLYGYTAYAASKGALIKMAEALHMEVSLLLFKKILDMFPFEALEFFIYLFFWNHLMVIVKIVTFFKT